VDGQENPLANTVDYGAHTVHRYHTLTGHCYLSRGIYMNRAEFERWPRELQEGIQRAAREAIAAQRDLAVEEEEVARKAIEAAGGEVVELTRDERAAFARAVKPLHDEARKCSASCGLDESDICRQDARAANKIKSRIGSMTTL
jgi:TRAP-type C4-dicarboxylate transport system substrate-binding protein